MPVSPRNQHANAPEHVNPFAPCAPRQRPACPVRFARTTRLHPSSQKCHMVTPSWKKKRYFQTNPLTPDNMGAGRLHLPWRFLAVVTCRRRRRLVDPPAFLRRLEEQQRRAPNGNECPDGRPDRDAVFMQNGDTGQNEHRGE